MTFEELLLMSSVGLGSLVAIGRTVEAIGAGKVIAKEDNWKLYFKGLSRKAKCILSVPSTHPSTLWELDWLANERLFSRVTMLFTELHFSDRGIQHFGIQRLSSKLASSGWMLPSNLSESALVTFDSSGAVNGFVRQSNHKVKSVRLLLKEVMSRS